MSSGNGEGGRKTQAPGRTDVHQAYRAVSQGKGLLLDVRGAGEYASAHAPGATLIPLPQLGRRYAELPGDQPIYVICHSGGRSAMAARQLAGLGYRVTNVDGGMSAWQRAGLPVEKSEQSAGGFWSWLTGR